MTRSVLFAAAILAVPALCGDARAEQRPSPRGIVIQQLQPAEQRDELAPFPSTEMHPIPQLRERIARYRIAGDQSGGSGYDFAIWFAGVRAAGAGRVQTFVEYGINPIVVPGRSSAAKTVVTGM